MSRKKHKPFLQTNQGRGIVGLVAIGIAFIFVFTLIPQNTSDNQADEDELENVRHGIEEMLQDTSIVNFQTDERIEGFVDTESSATRDMTDGGLIDIVDSYVKSGSISPLSEYLGGDVTIYYYWLEADGTLHQEVP